MVAWDAVSGGVASTNAWTTISMDVER